MPSLARPIALLRRFAAHQEGAIAPFTILVLGGALLVIAYIIDQGRALENTAQLKRATDAAAMAVGNQRLLDDRMSEGQMHSMASKYVMANLGMDRELLEQIGNASVAVTTARSDTSSLTIRVQATFDAHSELFEAPTKRIVVASTVEVVNRPVEVALMVPNTNSESAADIAALRRLTREFASDVFGTRPDARTWLALVPYSQAVNVYDPEDSNRILRWSTPSALRPVELRSLFARYAGLTDRRIPDRRANLLCMYRGLARGQNYFWDQAPSGQFKIYYRHDLPENGSPGAPAISWVGPNPMFGQASGVNDTRWMVADKGCPHAPLLPLTDQMSKIEQRLPMFQTRFNTNYAIAMGWAGMALSPQMRGTAGWGDAQLPLDFNPDNKGDNVKIVVMLANTVGDWFDTDAYNAEVGQAIDGGEEPGEGGINSARQRFISLCNSFRARGIKLHFLGVRPGDPQDFGRVLFDRVAGPGLLICTEGRDNMLFANATNFRDGEGQIRSLLKDITNKIKHERYVHLID
ncbi:hypothetical protein G3435_17135 [Pseudomonas sp. MAFF212428]|uniref:Pilus assembly protein n=2 Tax=Pseudomonas brassicae TaxID=2708063 RepID=A0A6B3NXI3_9PSED|nr:hypothetical protein [Pseudomonas brassicae]NER64910.1 hypothetical protein [Pseudomonas brassicae]